MSGYFSFFPTLLYSNTAATNVIAKIKFDESVTKRLAVFYPFTLTGGQRAEQVAEMYYDDPALDWLVYLSNGITDPYHEWHKGSSEFDKYINVKYGSAANAANHTAFYRTDYMFDDRVLTPAAYDALSTIQKQYWSPIIGYNDQIINYERKVMDMITDTNKVIGIIGTNFDFAEQDVIKQNAVDSMGTVAFANSTYMVLKHVTGEWTSGAAVSHTISNTSTSATVTSVSTISQPISNEEVPYWTAVSVYDVEMENNEAAKEIRLIGSQYVDVIERDMRDLLSV